jgi:hypothetical protein
VALVLMNQGKPELLSLTLIQQAAANAYYAIFLFTNNYQPTANDTINNYTKPAWQGYQDINLLRSQWGAPAINQGKGQSFYGSPLPAWTIGQAQVTIYGYGVYSLITQNLLWAEAFAQSRTLAQGDILTVQPEMTDDTDPNPI